jgi:hypothetical protein
MGIKGNNHSNIENSLNNKDGSYVPYRTSANKIIDGPYLRPKFEEVEGDINNHEERDFYKES